VACNQFFVPTEHSAAFEQRCGKCKSELKDCKGFVAFSILRRYGTAKGHGTTPMNDNEEPTPTIWKDQASFQKWRKGMAFQQAHGSGSSSNPSSGVKEPPQQTLWSRPPQPIFYEGTLVTTSEKGA
jgi:heme-degrading monooxygenase HmoA